MKDTSPAVERKFRGMLMQRTGVERLKMGCSLHATAPALAKADLAEQHPDAHPRELRQQLFRHFYGADFTLRQRKGIRFALSTRGRPGAVTARLPFEEHRFGRRAGKPQALWQKAARQL